MMLEDIRYFRAWPAGKEVLSLMTKSRFLIKIVSATETVEFDPHLHGYEWRVLSEALARSIVCYQKLCNEYADRLLEIEAKMEELDKRLEDRI